MSRDYTAEQISQTLFETDPLNTCCRENECWDEYDHVAQTIAQDVLRGASLQRALEKAISEWFYDGESFDASSLQPVIKQLEKVK
ncbi:MAG: hypothetical protein CMI01_15515 [Oceanospirillaceae bacterium]|jgi:hypothetical protein|nr:hypothetical protein [Oceanospirillaceae bacterium]|tara:strand:- start:2521 stop:2775 length:255 start_codon:yes stop_codon:yes gene_type:complete